ncbi:unnamed protein product [Blepharisma stoltei]|uniref:Uncharacterized protein n=1 Tax=Blepharisma stoltei TaxID=1481888 RepID=A0AAU9IY83_9CILI|nr:unnamed protein product [Blepharisma stoltei]
METKNMYFLQQRPVETIETNKNKKARFCDIIQIFEFPSTKDTLLYASNSVKQLEDIAFSVIKASQIDGRSNRSNNYFIKRYDLNGICTDFYTGEQYAWDMHPQAVHHSPSRRGIMKKKKNLTLKVSDEYEIRSREGFHSTLARSRSSFLAKLKPIDTVAPKRQNNASFQRRNIRLHTEVLTKRSSTSSNKQRSTLSGTSIITLSPLFK